MTGTGSDEGTRLGDERYVSRRQYLRALGTTAFGTALLTRVPSATAATVEDFSEAKPNHVYITDADTEYLNKYRPLLDLSAVPHENHPTLRGWKVTSTDGDVETDVAVYCCEYAVQKDVISVTSHAGDHEWIYVFTDSDTGEIREVSYTAYHWLRGYVTNPTVYTVDGGVHPTFKVASTYHNYVPDTDTSTGVLLNVESLGDYDSRSGPLYEWLRNGMAEDMEPGAVHNPWLLDSNGPLDAWWAREGSGRVNNWMVQAWAFVGFGFGIDLRGSGSADFGDRGGNA